MHFRHYVLHQQISRGGRMPESTMEWWVFAGVTAALLALTAWACWPRD